MALRDKDTLMDANKGVYSNRIRYTDKEIVPCISNASATNPATTSYEHEDTIDKLGTNNRCDHSCIWRRKVRQI